MSLLSRILTRLRHGGSQRISAGDPSAASSEVVSVASFRGRAERGEAEAQHQLGIAYETGRGVPQKFVEAVKWLRLAANQGWTASQEKLGEIYLAGRSAPGSVSPGAAAHLATADEN